MAKRKRSWISDVSEDDSDSDRTYGKKEGRAKNRKDKTTATDDSDSDGTYGKKEGRRKKRKNKTTAKSKKATSLEDFSGALKDLLKMPLDVLLEIFSHLKPIDLLHLSYTSKNLRGLLMDPSSKSVWKSARSNMIVSMPECPDDMTEAQYAELAFGKGCQYCGQKRGVIHTAWAARSRICNKCVPENCFMQDTLPRTLLETLRGRNVLAILPMIHIPVKQRHRMYYFQEYAEIWEEECKKLASPFEVEQWWDDKDAQYTARAKHGNRCRTWLGKLLRYENATIAELVELRKAKIAKQVEALGWRDEVKMMSPSETKFHECAEIDKLCRKDITAQDIADLEPDIRKYMERIKAARLDRERRVLIKKRLSILKKVYNDQTSSIPIHRRYMVPTVGELVLEPAIQDILNNHPKDISLTEDDLRPIVSAVFPTVTALLQRRIEDQLLLQVHSAKHASGDNYVNDHIILNLATTVFKCNSFLHRRLESRNLWYDEIPSHSCTRNNPFPTNDEDAESITCNLDETYRSYHTIVKADGCDVEVISNIVKLCGFDPTNTTKQMMDDLNPIFECLACHSAYKGRCTMTWTTAAVHYNHGTSHQYNSASGKEIQLELLTGADADVARARIAEQQARTRAQAQPCMVACAHCGRSGYEKPVLEEHLNMSHGISNHTDEDFILDPDKDHVPTPFFMWPPRPRST